MKYWEFTEMFRKDWGEKFIYLCFDMTKTSDEGSYRIFLESKNTYIECTCESEPF